MRTDAAITSITEAQARAYAIGYVNLHSKPQETYAMDVPLTTPLGYQDAAVTPAGDVIPVSGITYDFSQGTMHFVFGVPETRLMADYCSKLNMPTVLNEASHRRCTMPMGDDTLGTPVLLEGFISRPCRLLGQAVMLLAPYLPLPAILLYGISQALLADGGPVPTITAGGTDRA